MPTTSLHQSARWVLFRRALLVRSVGIALGGAILTSCSVLPRPLTMKEERIQIVPNALKVTERLERECKATATLTDVQAKPRLIISPPCPDFAVGSSQEMRRCGGVNNAQVVQVLAVNGSEERGASGAGLELTRDLSQGLARAEARNGHWGSAGAHQYRADSIDYQLKNTPPQTGASVEHAVPAGGYGHADWLPPADSWDLRFWQCPAPTPESEKGALVAHWPESRWDWAVDIHRDGRQVSRGRDGFEGLSAAVAAYPPALKYATQAEELGSSAVFRRTVSSWLLAPFFAGTGVAIAGLVLGYKKHWPGYATGMAAGGGGVMLISLAVGPIFDISSKNKGALAATEAMNAVDTYNEGYVRRPSSVPEF
jgi:hypothetical protein